MSEINARKITVYTRLLCLLHILMLTINRFVMLLHTFRVCEGSWLLDSAGLDLLGELDRSIAEEETWDGPYVSMLLRENGF